MAGLNTPKAANKSLKRKNGAFKIQRSEKRFKSRKTGGDGTTEGASGPDALANMSVDDFLQGGYEAAAVPAAIQGNRKGRPKEASKKGSKGAKAATALGKGTASPLTDIEQTTQKAMARAIDVNTAAEAKAAEASSKSSKNSEMREHMAQLEALKQKDPEFYKYLSEADKELLEFGGDESDEDVEAEDSESLDLSEKDEADGTPTTKPAVKAGKENAAKLAAINVLDQKAVDKWCREAKDPGSASALDRLIKAYRIACHLGDEEEDMGATMQITSSAVFNKILIFVIKEADGLFRKHLKLPAGQITPQMIRKSQRWRKFENPVKSYLGNSLHLLTELTDEKMLIFMLRHLRQSAAFLFVSERLQRKLLKLLLQLFGQGATGVRLQAVLFMRQMAICLPPPTLDLVMKGVYRTFVINSKFMSTATLPHISFMATCVVEIFGLDSAAAYELAFGYIKQLAVLLRSALSMKTKDSFREVYCWQTISSLELWAKLLSTHANKQELRPLVYPLTQILIGTVRLVPTARYFPLRLRCVRALNGISRATGLFVPVAPLLLETLQWKGLHTAVKSGNSPPQGVVPQLRAGKQLLATAGFQQSLVEDVLLLLAEHLGQWATSPAFPELSHFILLQLRKMAKESKVEKFRLTAKGLMAAIQSNATFVTQARNRLECSPKDTAALAKFLASDAERKQAPMQKYADLLAEKAAKKQALAKVDELTLGPDALGHDESSEDEEGLPNSALLPELQKRSAAKRSGKGIEESAKMLELQEDEDEDDTEGDESDSDEEEDGEDKIRELVLSDSESD